MGPASTTYLFRLGSPSESVYSRAVAQPLSSKHRSFLRALAHHLDPVVQVGKLGVSPAVVQQITEQLRAHELIKVSFGREAPEAAAEVSEALAAATDSQLIQCRGRILTVYRRHDHEPKIVLPGTKARTKTEPESEQRRDPRRSLRGLRSTSSSSDGAAPRNAGPRSARPRKKTTSTSGARPRKKTTRASSRPRTASSRSR